MIRALPLLLAATLASPALAERTFGLVIGIDDYVFVSDLQGAVNDAEDVADALEGLGAEVTLLTDHDATRAAILGAWEDILARSEPGDRLVVSYAGHGSHEPEATVGSEEDGRDENFLLAGFAPHGPSSAERIRDDEIAALLERSAALDVIFVADACHSGTVTRNLDPALGYRYVAGGSIEGDPLPPPPPPPSGEGSASVALFLAAVNEAEKVPEVMIDGQARGALSYAFADGLRGAADFDGNGTVTKGELELHVRRTVRDVTDGVQLPQSSPAGQETRSLVRLRAAAPAAVAGKPLRDRPLADLDPVTVADAANWTGVSGIAQDALPALRRQGPTIRTSVGDTLATGVATDRLQDIIDTRRVVTALRRMSDPTLQIEFGDGDRTYMAGEILQIGIDGRLGQGLTLINIGSDGTVSYLYPAMDLGDPDTLAPGRPLSLPVAIAAPFGADHIVAIETSGAPSALRGRLSALDGTRAAAPLWDILRRSGARLSVFPFFSAEHGA